MILVTATGEERRRDAVEEKPTRTEHRERRARP
jgi:hypothetical protein